MMLNRAIMAENSTQKLELLVPCTGPLVAHTLPREFEV